MPSELEKSIYKTLAYFAYFTYPMTSFEIWKWLLDPGQAASLSEVIDTLDNSAWLRSRLLSHQGFYGLGDVWAWRKDRHVRFLDAMRKYRKAERAVQLLGRLPWIEGIAICNSLSWYQTKADSDIDLFIIAKPGRVWSSRLLSTIPVILLRQRPGESASDPMCLSFFCSQTALAFEKLKIGSTDPYLAYWSRSLVPLVDHGGWLARFESENVWLKNVLPNAQFVRRARRFKPSIRLRLPWIPVSEKLPKQIQLERFPKSIRDLMNVDSRVVINDDMLKFHEQDSRELIRVTLENKITAL